MSNSEAALSAPWQYYSDRAHEAHSCRADHFGAGREEQLWEILNAIESNQTFDDACRQRLDRIPQNRAKKHLRLLLAYSLIAPESAASCERQVDLVDEVQLVERHLSPEERVVERRLASGETYAQIASGYGASLSALKVRVNRWRERVRSYFANRSSKLSVA
jgi:DNA-directed RNA polymerase specialized sigma24 family protein